MKSPSEGPTLGPPGWRALLSFWVLILSFGITTLSLLQELGPPSRHSEKTVISSRPAEPASGRQIGNPAPPSLPQDRNPLRAIKDPTTGAHPAMESRAQSSVPLSRAPPGDLEQAMDAKMQLYERAQEAAAAGKFNAADKALALADKLALHLPTPTVPPAGGPAEPPTGEGMAAVRQSLHYLLVGILSLRSHEYRLQHPFRQLILESVVSRLPVRRANHQLGSWWQAVRELLHSETPIQASIHQCLLAGILRLSRHEYRLQHPFRRLIL